MAEHDHAILVGIASYPEPTLGDLVGPSIDVFRFARWLRSPSGGGVPANQMELVFTGSRRYRPRRPTRIDHAHPTSLDFDDAYNTLIARPRRYNGRIGRRLYLYFSGHGFEDPDGLHQALYSARAKENNWDHIPVTHFARGLRQEGLFQEIVVTMDCCRGVEPWKVIREPTAVFGSNAGAAASTRLYRAYAASYGNPAVDAQSVKLPDGKLGGVFTWALVDALRRTPANAAGQVTGRSVRDYIHQSWPRLKETYKCPSDPDIKPEEGDEIVWLDRIPGSSNTRVVFDAPELVDGTKVMILAGAPPTEVGSITIEGGRAEKALTPGIYKAQALGYNEAPLFEVSGDSIHVRIDR